MSSVGNFITVLYNTPAKHRVMRNLFLGCVLGMFPVAAGVADAAVPGTVPVDLSGEWVEVREPPIEDPGVVQFTQTGSEVEGRYIKVNPFLEQYFGFKKNELVFKGTIEGNQLKGSLLVKQRTDFESNCLEVPAAKWVPIAVEINEAADFLNGVWENEEVNFDSCVVVRELLEPYQMKRVK